MKAIRFDRYGGPEVLQLVELPDPEPGPGELLIDVRAVSVVPGDCKLRLGELTAMFPISLPKIPGRDGAGIVLATGDGAAGFAVGDRVCFTCRHVDGGTYAQRAVRPAASVVPMPEGLDFIEGAGLMQAGVCAWIAAVETAGVQAGERVLVHAAAGSVGGMAVQLCRHLGAEVAGTCRERNREHVAALGCHRIVPYDRAAFESVLPRQDVVIDLVGGDVHRRSREILRPGGRLAWLIAELFEDRPARPDIEVRQAKIVDTPDILRAVVDLAEAGHWRPLVSRVLPLDRAAEAHRILEAGENSRGRLVLDTQRLAD